MKTTKTIYLIQLASSDKNGSVSPFSKAFSTLDEAKKYLEHDFLGRAKDPSYVNLQRGTDNLWWSCEGPFATRCEIVSQGIDFADDKNAFESEALKEALQQIRNCWATVPANYEEAREMSRQMFEIATNALSDKKVVSTVAVEMLEAQP